MFQICFDCCGLKSKSKFSKYIKQDFSRGFPPPFLFILSLFKACSFFVNTGRLSFELQFDVLKNEAVAKSLGRDSVEKGPSSF